MAQSTMKAVVFDGPHKVSVQDRPVPKREFHPDGTWGLLEVGIGPWELSFLCASILAN